MVAPKFVFDVPAAGLRRRQGGRRDRKGRPTAQNLEKRKAWAEKRQAPTPQAGRREEEPPLEGPQEEKGAGGGKEENVDREPTPGANGARWRRVASGRRARVKRSSHSSALW